jgi:hypothetical protein
MGPGNNSGVSMSVPLRELKILLKDPENGALLAPHLELAITQACGARIEFDMPDTLGLPQVL